MNVTNALSRLGQVLALAFVFTGTTAFGQTLMTTSPPQSPVPFSISGITGSQNITFDSFNTALGTLQSVTITLTNVVVSGTATLTANIPGQEVFSANLTGAYILTDTLGNTIAANVATAVGPDKTVSNGSTYYVLAAPNNGAVGTSPPGGAQPASSTPQDSTPLVITGSNLSIYESGASTVTLSMSGHNTLNSSTSGAFTTTVSGTGTGTVTVVYTYLSSVPEPSQTAACMIGFALCLFVGRNYFKGRGFRIA